MTYDLTVLPSGTTTTNHVHVQAENPVEARHQWVLAHRDDVVLCCGDCCGERE